jgi:hypothetical protein
MYLRGFALRPPSAAGPKCRAANGALVLPEPDAAQTPRTTRRCEHRVIQHLKLPSKYFGSNLTFYISRSFFMKSQMVIGKRSGTILRQIVYQIIYLCSNWFPFFSKVAWMFWRLDKMFTFMNANDEKSFEIRFSMISKFNEIQLR